MNTWDVVIVGAGAAGLFCAGVAGQRGLKVLVIDHSDKIAEKVRISGGGRCNFTNRLLDPTAPQKHFISQNPHFCRSALSRYTPQDFIDLVQKHGIAFHEKHKGQLFCDHSAEDIIRMLLAECDAGGVTRWAGCSVTSVQHQGSEGEPGHYTLNTDQGPVTTTALVVATLNAPLPANEENALDQVVELVEQQILLQQAQVIQGQVLEVEVQVPLGQQLQLESEVMAVTVK